MKWIGQHIYDFISRFRTTVYIENLETSSEENVLVVDSDGKVTKNTTLGGSDVTMTDGVDNRVMTATGATAITGESQFTFSGGQAQMFTDDSGPLPRLVLHNKNTGSDGAKITFQKQADTSNANDNDVLGQIHFVGDDSAGNDQTYATFKAFIADQTATEEAGRIELQIAEYDGTLTTGLKLDGDTDADGEIDVTIGAGAASTTTIAGDLTVTSGLTIGGHKFDDIDIGSEFVDTDDHIMSSGAIKEKIESYSYSTTTAASLGISGSVNQLLTDNGNGTVTSESTATFTGDTMKLTSLTSGKPQVSLTAYNTAADECSKLIFTKDASNVEDGEYLGSIDFYGENDNGTPETIQYCKILARATDVTDGQEAGSLIFQVAEYDGTLTNGLIIQGDTDANGELDVTIGAGAASMTTIAGDLDIDGDNITAAGALTITPGGTFAVAGGSNEIDLTTTGTLDINAGTTLDIDVTGNTTFDTPRLILTGTGGLEIVDTTTSSATEGGQLVLSNDDGAAMGSGHRLGVIRFKGAEDGSSNTTTGARIEALTDAAWSTSENGADLVFYTTDGNASESEVMRCTASTGVSIPRRKFTMTSSTDHEAQGDVVFFGTAGGTYAQGDICYLNTDGSWISARANAENTSSQLLGVALGGDPAVNGMLLRGMITLDHDTTNSNDGRAIYLSEDTAGQATQTIPADAGNVVRIVGYKMGDDDQVWFCPDNTYILRA